MLTKFTYSKFRLFRYRVLQNMTINPRIYGIEKKIAVENYVENVYNFLVIQLFLNFM